METAINVDAREPTRTQKGPQPLPCPLCGGPAYAHRTVNGTQMFHVGCSPCGLDLKAAWYRDEDAPTKDILALWNTRPQVAESAALVAELRQELKTETNQRVELEAMIGSVTAAVAGWDVSDFMESFELVRSVIDLKAQRDAAEVEVAGLRQDLQGDEVEIASLRTQLREYEEREAACCPEDWSFDDYIKVLHQNVAAFEKSEAGLRVLIAQLEAIPQLSSRQGIVVSARDVNAVIRQAHALFAPGRPARSFKEFHMELPDIEVVSAKVHEAWIETKRAQGITSRPDKDGIEQMVPYEQLPHHLQDLDRATVRAVYAAIQQAARSQEERHGDQ